MSKGMLGSKNIFIKRDIMLSDRYWLSKLMAENFPNISLLLPSKDFSSRKVTISISLSETPFLMQLAVAVINGVLPCFVFMLQSAFFEC